MHSLFVLRVAALVALFTTLCAWSPAVHAAGGAERGAARTLGVEGVKDYQAGKYKSAAEQLDKAFDILQAPALGLWSARAFEKLGRLVEASERYLKTTRLPIDPDGDEAIQRQAIADAHKAYEALQPRIPTLVIVLEGGSDDLQVRANGKQVSASLVGVGFPVDPGTTEIVATAGDQEARGRVTLAEGEKKTLRLDWSAAPKQKGAAITAAGGDTSGDVAAEKSSGSWKRTTGWIGVSVGGAVLIGGAVATGLLVSQKNQLGCDKQGNCPGNTDQGDLQMYNNLRPISTALLAAGGVLTATGVVLLLTTKKASTAAQVTPYVGFAAAGFQGRF
jgi:hypothetical protein